MLENNVIDGEVVVLCARYGSHAGNWSARVLINMHAALPISCLSRSHTRSRVYNKICNQLAGSARGAAGDAPLRPGHIYRNLCAASAGAAADAAVVYCNSCFFIPR